MTEEPEEKMLPRKLIITVEMDQELDELAQLVTRGSRSKAVRAAIRHFSQLSDKKKSELINAERGK